MPEPENHEPDQWLTPGQIAEELALNPATVRQWITKGELPASRVGMRKLRVRRSDLDALLTRWQRSEPAGRSEPDPGSPDEPQPAFGGSAAPMGAGERTRELVRNADRSLAKALYASARARPSAGYTNRLRAIADGFEHVAATCIHGARSAGASWGGRAFGFGQLPYELRPGGNRPSPEGLWDAFDSAIDDLGGAFAGHDLELLGVAFRKAGDELLRVAKRLDESGLTEHGSQAAAGR